MCRRQDSRNLKAYIVRKNLFPVQIENVLTASLAILEAAAVSVPDSHYGEVVGTWIVRDPHLKPISREEVRNIVATSMNPQVACPPSHQLVTFALNDFLAECAEVGLVRWRGRL